MKIYLTLEKTKSFEFWIMLSLVTLADVTDGGLFIQTFLDRKCYTL